MSTFSFYFVTILCNHNSTANAVFMLKMEKRHLETLRPIKVKVWLKWFNARSTVHQESLEAELDITNPGSVFTITGLPDIPSAKEIGIKIYFDDKLLCYTVQSLESSEVWR